MSDETTEVDIADFNLTNYPVGSADTVVRTVVLGGLSDDFVFLLELNPDSGLLKVSIGNGPENADVPVAIPDILRQMANIIEELGDAPEFLSQLDNPNTD